LDYKTTIINYKMKITIKNFLNVMKKYLVLAALASVALVGCTKNVVIDASEAELIAFAPVQGLSATRANVDGPISGTAYPEAEHFAAQVLVTGKTADESYINLSEIQKVGDNWRVDGERYYWPKDGSTLDFYAYSPYGAEGLTLNTEVKYGWTIADYTPSTEDLMLADPVLKQTKSGNENGVTTTFHHVLSFIKAVTIHTKDDYSPDMTYELVSLTLDTLNTKGSFDGEATWTVSGTKDVDINDGTMEVTKDSKPVKLVNNGTVENGYYFILPQTAVNLKVVYKVTNASKYTETRTAFLKLAEKLEDGQFKINTAYVLDLEISEDEILWAPKVVDWTTETVGTITVQ